jgi:hypothetical protein
MAYWNVSSGPGAAIVITDTTLLTSLVSNILPSTGNANTGCTKGLVPPAIPSDVALGKYLRADAVWAIPDVFARPYTFQQVTAASVWTISHNMGRFPAVTLFTTGGIEMEGDIVNLSPNVVQVRFVIPIAGIAICL